MDNDRQQKCSRCKTEKSTYLEFGMNKNGLVMKTCIKCNDQKKESRNKKWIDHHLSSWIIQQECINCGVDKQLMSVYELIHQNHPTLHICGHHEDAINAYWEDDE